MRILIGCDLVHIPTFQKTVASDGTGASLSRIFTDHELSRDTSPETLAGAFAAKEAVVKALDLPAGSFLKMEIVRGETGRPSVRLADRNPDIVNCDLSISHSGEYALASVAFLLGSGDSLLG